MDGDFGRFLERWPAYAATAALDGPRAADCSRLGRSGQVYLDCTGWGLYADSQVERHMELLRSGVFGSLLDK